MRADLHTHSTCSDGTVCPGGTVEAALAAGLDAVALTDHDTTAGWAQAADAAAGRIALVRGMELSCRVEGMSVHVLSYLHDPADPGLLATLARTRTSRLERARAMTQRLAECYDLTWADVLAQAGPGATVGRPHIADALVAKGIVPDRSAAFATLLRPGQRFYVPHWAPEGPEGVALIRAAGGVPVLAHPGARSRGRIVTDAHIEEMIEAGLAGLEIRHRDNPQDQRERLAAIARRHDLLVTGSSDWHGAGKPNLIGENTTDAATVERIAAQGRLQVLGA